MTSFPNLNTSPAGMAQGLHRHERAVNFYSASRYFAQINDLPFEWRIVTMGGIAHGIDVHILLDVIRSHTG